MRVWTKSACAVLAWGLLLTLLVTGMGGSAPRAQANMRIAFNRRIIGPDPNLIHPGTVLTLARPAPPAAPAGMPQWLRIMLLATGLLIGAAFLAELLLATARRRRQAAAGSAEPPTASHREPSEAAPVITQEPHIVLADYDRLVVTHNKADDTVCVLRPPGADPRAILRVARLVLPEDPYEQLADHLGVPASWPME